MNPVNTEHVRAAVRTPAYRQHFRRLLRKQGLEDATKNLATALMAQLFASPLSAAAATAVPNEMLDGFVNLLAETRAAAEEATRKLLPADRRAAIPACRIYSMPSGVRGWAIVVYDDRARE